MNFYLCLALYSKTKAPSCLPYLARIFCMLWGVSPATALPIVQVLLCCSFEESHYCLCTLMAQYRPAKGLFAKVKQGRFFSVPCPFTHGFVRGRKVSELLLGFCIFELIDKFETFCLFFISFTTLLYTSPTSFFFSHVNMGIISSCSHSHIAECRKCGKNNPQSPQKKDRKTEL